MKSHCAPETVSARNHAEQLAEVIMRFCYWMDTRATPATWLDVANAFDVSRATAYRWIKAWRAATGMPSLRDQRQQYLEAQRKHA